MTHNLFHGGLLNVESKNIAVSAVILAVSSIASRLLGVLRDWLLAERFGASSDLDAYFAAFRIPDFIYNILVFGAIVVAFLPLFSDYYSKNKEEAWRFANNTLNVFLAFLVTFCAIGFIFTPQLIALIAPGFSTDLMAKTVILSRLMFLSPIIFGIASIFSGILQYFRRFLAYSLAASLYNIGIIAGIIFLSPSLGIYGVAGGVIAGALLYLLIQVIPAVKCGYCYQPVFNFREPSLGRVIWLMLPRTVGIAANQINLIAPTIIASALAAGSITVFNLANNIYAIPVGIIGISWATAAFATFSKYFASGQLKELAQKFAASFNQIGFLVVPASFMLFILRDQVVALLYRHGAFSDQAALLTSASLGLFCLGIYFSAMMPVIFRLFFSLCDTATPTITTVVSVAANIILNYALVAAFGAGVAADLSREFFGLGQIGDISVLGLALAYSIANALQFALLFFLLRQKHPELVLVKNIASSFLRTIAAAVPMALAVYLVSAIMPKANAIQALLNLLSAGAAGAIVYVFIAAALKSPEIAAMISTVRNYGTKQSKRTS